MSRRSNREFLMLAQTYKPAKHAIDGYYVSEKLDGTRCLWDGGITRGMPTDQVPWANIYHPKTGEKKTKIKPESTGLWSRYGNPIIAPDWWLNLLPCMLLDGELWAGPGSFQLSRSICSKDEPVASDWEQIKFAVFGSPPFEALFSSGTIKNSNMVLKISLPVIQQWLNMRPDSLLREYRFLRAGVTFDEELAIINDALSDSDQVYLLKQKQLPFVNAKEILEDEMARVADHGGEGVVLRKPNSIWKPMRSWSLLKYKFYIDVEGTIVGFTSGRQTDKGSRLLGKLGALILDYNGKRLELSGLTDAEREFATPASREWATLNPGIDAPQWVVSKTFKRGQSITFTYRELTNDGIPREARYLRKQFNA